MTNPHELCTADCPDRKAGCHDTCLKSKYIQAFKNKERKERFAENNCRLISLESAKTQIRRNHHTRRK